MVSKRPRLCGRILSGRERRCAGRRPHSWERMSRLSAEMRRDCLCGPVRAGMLPRRLSRWTPPSRAVGNGASLFRSLMKVDRTEHAYRTPSIGAPPALGLPEIGPPLSPVADIPDKKITRLVVIDRRCSGTSEKTRSKTIPNSPGLTAAGIPRSLGPMEVAVWAAAASMSLEAKPNRFWLNWRGAHSDVDGFCPEQNVKKMAE
jgi:hypothetical protein